MKTYNFYSLSQHFVGGALSGYAGYSFSLSKPMNLEYIQKVAHKKFFQYGLQSISADFAYDKERAFFKKNIGQHLGTFVIGGTGGLLQMHSMNNDWVRGGDAWTGRVIKGMGLSVLSYGAEYIGVSFVKGNYQKLKFYGILKKAGVSSYKSIMYSLILK